MPTRIRRFLIEGIEGMGEYGQWAPANERCQGPWAVKENPI